MSDVLIDPAEDSPDVALPTTEAVRNIAELARQQMQAEAEVEEAEAALKRAKEQLRNIQEKLLPDAMSEVGVTEFKLTGGGKVTVKPYYSASLRRDAKDRAEAWLNENGHGGMVKREISVRIGRGQDKIAERVRNGLRSADIPFEEDVSVHPQTLAAWAREMTESNQPIPEDLFTVYIGSKAIVKF